MDPELKKILDALPEKPPRSRLQPYRELIEELRRRGRTYREISGILAEKCEVKVTASGIHDFLRTRAQPRGSIVDPNPRRATAGKSNPSPAEQTSRRIAYLKARSIATKPELKFEFSADEPLKISKTTAE